MQIELALLALLLAGYALVAAGLERLSVGPALAFVIIGFLTSEDTFGPISLEPSHELIRVLAEGALALLLFADASAVTGQKLRHDAAAIGRLLVVGLLLTILLGTAAAALLFPGISFGLALLIGSALAPTDAALGQPVFSNPSVPVRIRRLLNVESGLNDGIATPFVLLAIAIASAEGTTAAGWVGDAVAASGIGLVVGLLLGFLGGRLLEIADRFGLTSRESKQLFILALAVASYLVSSAIGGNGFIAAFVGGLAFGAGSAQGEERALRFTEVQGTLLAIGVWTSFGLIVAGELGTTLWSVSAIVYAVLSLTVIRMLPVAISLLGTRFQRETILFIGWFGPRGLASIVFLIIGIESLSDAGVDTGPLAATITWTVLLSVVLHGVTAGPLARRYGQKAATWAADSPELEDAPEPTAPRHTLPRHAAG